MGDLLGNQGKLMEKKYFLETQVSLVVLRASIEPSYARTHSSLPYIKK